MNKKHYVIEAKGYGDWYERDFFETREEAEETMEELREKHSGCLYGFHFRIKEKEE